MSRGLTTPGTRPKGAAGENEAAEWVRGMFGAVAPRYDLVNRVISFRLDQYWRRRTARRLRHVLSRPEARVLDLCCGSGDLTLALQARAGGAVIGSDFCHPMLIEAARKFRRNKVRPLLFEADAMRLPVPDSSLDLVTAAFGFRNLANYRKGLEEMLRVLRPGGSAAVLEFSQPPNRAFNALYTFYFTRLLPIIGGLISGSREAYTYLPESVEKFPDAHVLAERMKEAGFRKVEYELMSFGIVALHVGTR